MRNARLYTSLIAFIFVCNGVLAHNLHYPTSDLQSFISSADLIVVGKPNKVLQKGLFYGYQANAEALKELDKLTPIPLGMPYVDYEIQVDELIKADHNIMRGKPIVYRVLQFYSNESVERQLSAKPALFFLSKVKDREIYGLKTAQHRLQLNQNAPVSYIFEGEEFILHSIKEARDLSSPAFVQAIRNAVNKAD